jgi:hypothetical protein
MICAAMGKRRRQTKNENGAFTRVGPDGAGLGSDCRRAQRPRLIRKIQKLCGMRKVLCLFFYAVLKGETCKNGVKVIK